MKPLKIGWASVSLLTLIRAGHAGESAVPGQLVVPGVSSGVLLQHYQGVLAPDANAPVGARGEHKPTMAQRAEQGRTLRVMVKHFVLSEPLPGPAAAKAQQIFTAFEGRQLGSADVVRVRNLLNAMLSREMDALTYARLPQQDISDGIVHFEIERGRIGRLELNNRSRVSNSVVSHYLPSNDVGERRNLDALAQMNRRLSALPGIGQAAVSLAPGDEPGTTNVTANITPASPIEGVLLANNSGAPSSGANMVGAQVALNSPLGIGDRLQSTLFYAPPGAQNAVGQGGHTSFAALSYDAPVGYRGTRGGVQYNRVDYTQGGPGDLRELFDGHGSADGIRTYVSHPLLARDDANVTMGASLEHKNLKDSFFGVMSRRRLWTGGASVSGFKAGQLAARPNVVRFDAELKAGQVQVLDVGINDDAAGDLSRSLISRRFAKLSVGGEYLQLIRPGLTFSLKGNAQFSLPRHHLDPSEQMSLGGAQGVRGYDSGLSTVDQGALMSTTLTQALEPIPGLSMSVFYDRGNGQISRSNIAAGGCGCTIPDNLMTVQAAGVGLDYHYGSKFSVSVVYARQIGAVPENQYQRRRAQTWVNAKLAF
ncbi:ShlB/FhaC/HecB family hemolysin secretion/activation protein [Dyella monticola]|nr:ShlB/FhaC/HecB family hemolysin secretion/activation protein [Dyella monticola]